MAEFDYLIVGGGLAASSAVDGIREVDPEGTIAILTDEEEPPYHRPPLSKEYLRTPGAGRHLLHVKPEGWFDEQEGVELRRGTRAVSLDPRERSVSTSTDEEVHGERLLLATGGRPRALDVPGADLDGVFTLRTVEDSEAIREAAGEASEAILVGAGFIGMELAASLRQLGVSPTVVEIADRAWGRLLPAEYSGAIQEYFEERGVRFRLGASVAEFRGDGRLESVLLDGGEKIPSELAVVGVGIAPNVELAAEAGLAVQDGVVVDRYGETSHGYIYAAGDVARFPDPLFGELARVEHWDHAKAHGTRVGRNMAGEEEEYDHVSYFFSDVFDLSLNVFGRAGRGGRTVLRGEFGEEGGVVFCEVDGRLGGAILVNASEQMDECRELVNRRPAFEDVERKLSDPETDLATLPG